MFIGKMWQMTFKKLSAGRIVLRARELKRAEKARGCASKGLCLAKAQVLHQYRAKVCSKGSVKESDTHHKHQSGVDLDKINSSMIQIGSEVIAMPDYSMKNA